MSSPKKNAPGALTQQNNAATRSVGGCVDPKVSLGLSDRTHSLPIPGIEPRTAQPVFPIACKY
jgi:hypothetical protein